MKFYFFLHFWTNWNLKHYRYNKMTKWKINKKMFLIEIWTKINFGWRNCNFQSLRGHQNIKKSSVNNDALSKRPRNPKTYWPFSNFIAPVRTIWHDPSIELDLSCSEHIFWLHCDHFSIQNDLISIFTFLLFFIFDDFRSVSIFPTCLMILHHFFSILFIKSSPNPLYNLLA